MPTESDWHHDRTALSVLGLYALLTLLGVGLSTGLLVPDSWFEIGKDPPPTRVPPFVYLYAFLGASAFAFSNLLQKGERDWRDLVRLGMRVFSALPLAAGVYLLGSFLGGGLDVAGGRAAAGLAFLTGLYVNLALEGLYGLGMRLYGLAPSEEAEESSQPETDAESGDETPAGESEAGDSMGESTGNGGG